MTNQIRAFMQFPYAKRAKKGLKIRRARRENANYNGISAVFLYADKQVPAKFTPTIPSVSYSPREARRRPPKDSSKQPKTRHEKAELPCDNSASISASLSARHAITALSYRDRRGLWSSEGRWRTGDRHEVGREFLHGSHLAIAIDPTIMQRCSLPPAQGITGAVAGIAGIDIAVREVLVPSRRNAQSCGLDQRLRRFAHIVDKKHIRIERGGIPVGHAQGQGPAKQGLSRA